VIPVPMSQHPSAHGNLCEKIEAQTASDFRKLDVTKKRSTAPMLQTFCDTVRVMVQYIKIARNNFRSVADQLTSAIVVRATGVPVVNPWSAINLPGIVEILCDRFLMKTFVSFTSSLSAPMSVSLTAAASLSNPMAGVHQMWKMYSTLESKGMWDELIRGIHPSAPVRLLTELTKFLKPLSRRVQPCSPPCYKVQCRKCDFYGHRQNSCKQATSVSGDELSH